MRSYRSLHRIGRFGTSDVQRPSRSIPSSGRDEAKAIQAAEEVVAQIEPSDIPSFSITADKLAAGAVNSANIQGGAITAAQLNPQLLSDLQDAKLPTDYATMLKTTNDCLIKATNIIESLAKRLEELEDAVQDQALREVWARNRGRD
jgi:hypothetical protein